jgi:hypothetical protein
MIPTALSLKLDGPPSPNLKAPETSSYLSSTSSTPTSFCNAALRNLPLPTCDNFRQISLTMSEKTLLLPKHELPLPKVDDEKKNREDDEKSVTKSRHPRSSHQPTRPRYPQKRPTRSQGSLSPYTSHRSASGAVQHHSHKNRPEQTRTDQNRPEQTRRKKSSMYYIPPKLLQEKKKKPRSYANYIPLGNATIQFPETK